MRCYILWVSNVYTCLHRTEQPPATAFMHLVIFDACCIMGDNALGDDFARGCGGSISLRHCAAYRESSLTYGQYKSCVRERQLESVEAFSLCCYMQTCFDSSVLSPVVHCNHSPLIKPQSLLALPSYSHLIVITFSAQRQWSHFSMSTESPRRRCTRTGDIKSSSHSSNILDWRTVVTPPLTMSWTLQTQNSETKWKAFFLERPSSIYSCSSLMTIVCWTLISG